MFNTQDKNHTPRVLLTPQRACLVAQRGASKRPGWDSSAGMELLTPSSPSWTSAHTAGQPLGQQQLDTCCSCVLGCVLWSLFTLTWFSRITSPLPIFCQPHVKLQRNAVSVSGHLQTSCPWGPSCLLSHGILYIPRAETRLFFMPFLIYWSQK